MSTDMGHLDRLGKGELRPFFWETPSGISSIASHYVLPGDPVSSSKSLTESQLFCYTAVAPESNGSSNRYTEC